MIERLGRIEALEWEGADPRAILAEVRELLREGEAWLQAEGCESGPAADALARCRRVYDAEALPVT